MADSPTFFVLVTGIVAGGTPTVTGYDSIEAYFSGYSANPNIRVLVYHTVNISDAGFPPFMPRLHDSARNLLQELQELQSAMQIKEEKLVPRTRNQSKEKNPTKLKPKLVFLGHDIGGFVIKQALVLANSDCSYEWIATGTVAVLLFQTPHTELKSMSWGNIVVKILAESPFDLPSFVQYLPSYAAHLEAEFEGIAGSYHIINFLPNQHGHSTWLTTEHLRVPIYKCDKTIMVDCNPHQMWQFGDEIPWSGQIRDVINHHLKLKADYPEEVSRRLLRSLAQLYPELHQLRDQSCNSIPIDVTRWITRSWYNDWTTKPEIYLLHVLGCHGTGTSLFVAKLATHLRFGKNLVLSFSVGRSHERSGSTVDLFRSFCQQALLTASARRSTTQLYSYLISGRIFTKDAFKRLLCSVLSSHTGKPVFCIVDSIHNYELKLRSELLADIEQLKSSSQGPFKLLLTSDAPQEWPKSLHPYRVVNLAREMGEVSENKPVSQLQLLAKARLDNLGTANPVWRAVQWKDIERLWAKPTSLLEVSQKIAFLERADPSSPEDAMDLLSNIIPTSFNDFFYHVDANFGFLADGSLGAAVLPWIIYSHRPMTLSELAVCVALERAEAGGLTAAHLRKRIAWNLRANLEASLGLVITVSGEKVRIRHQVFEELLLGRPQLQGDIHLQLLGKCIEYLRAISSSWSSGHEHEKEFLLIEYAALYWPVHYIRANDEVAACSFVMSLFHEDETFKKWLEMYYKYSKGNLRQEALPTTRIHVAGRFGLTAVLRTLVPTPASTPKLSTELELAMDLAAENGHVDTVRHLIAEKMGSKSTLIRASRTGNLEIMRELLSANKECGDSPRGSGANCNALLEAARYGHTSSFALLMDGAEPASLHSMEPETKLTALHLAARIGNLEIVKLLVNANSSLSTTDNRGYDALKYAAEAGFADIVELIIDENESKRAPGVVKVAMDVLINGQTRVLDTPLHMAASNGHIQTVNVLLQKRLGANLHIRNNRGYTALHCAAEGGFRTTVKRILTAITEGYESGTVPNNRPTLDLFDRKPDVPSPLQLAIAGEHLNTVEELRGSGFYNMSEALASVLATACDTGNTDIVLYLLNWYKDITSSDKPLQGEGGNSALHLAARRGDAAMFRSIENSGLVPINFVNKEGRKPVHEAALSGNLSILRRFSFEFGLGESMVDVGGKTPLHLAVEAGHVRTVKWLLKYPAYQKEQNIAREKTVVMRAVVNNHEDIVSLLPMHRYAGETGSTLHAAIGGWWRGVTQQTVPKGGEALLNRKDSENGDTVLHIAVQRNNQDIIRAILDAGADVNIKNKRGKSAFALAMEANDVDTVRVLLDRSPGIKVNELDGGGMTPLMRAYKCSALYVGVFRELLSKRIGEVHPRVPHKTLLYVATTNLAEDGNMEMKMEMLKLLLKAGADPNVGDEEGTTPLFIASHIGHIGAIKALLEHGADVNARNNTGSSALHRAAQSSHLDCIQLLVEHGADVNAVKNANGVDIPSGVTPLVAAVLMDELAAVELLAKHHATLGRALHFAIQGESVEMVELLLEKYYYPTKADPDGGTPLYMAVIMESREILNLLLKIPDARLQINEPNLVGFTLLHIAVMRRRKDLVEMLITANADVNKRDLIDMTPLYHAIQGGNKDLVELLCKCPSIDLSASGPRNQSPLYLACRQGNDEIFDLVKTATKQLGPQKYAELCDLALHAVIPNKVGGSVDHFIHLLGVEGVKGNVRDQDGWTPLDWVNSYNREELKQQILEHCKNQVPLADYELPTCWHPSDRHPTLSYAAWDNMEDSKVAEVKANMGRQALINKDHMAVARADHCIPFGKNYYFEITIESVLDKATIFGIGLCDDATPFNCMLGFGRGTGISFGYHADDGHYYRRDCDTAKISRDYRYSEGDTVGCLVNAENKTISFTQGGLNRGVAFTGVYGKLYPAIFIGARGGVRISAVFPDANGNGNFRYDWKRSVA